MLRVLTEPHVSCSRRYITPRPRTVKSLQFDTKNIRHFIKQVKFILLNCEDYEYSRFLNILVITGTGAYYEACYKIANYKAEHF